MNLYYFTKQSKQNKIGLEAKQKMETKQVRYN